MIPLSPTIIPMKILAACFSLLCVAAHAAQTTAIIGATPAGFAAAISARRAGAESVVLLEPSAQVGGRFAEALGFGEVDRMKSSTVGGLWTELRKKVDGHYGRVTLSPEPHVHERILEEWLIAEGVTVMKNFQPSHVRKTGARIQGIVATDKREVVAAIYIDATYHGDLLPLAGVTWTIGRESRQQYGESLAGVLLELKDPPGPIDIPIWRSPISGFHPDGKTLLPHVQGLTTDVVEGSGDTHLQCANLYACLTKDPANQIELREPANYDPWEFELLRRELARPQAKAPFGFSGGVPNDKTKMNDGVDRLLHWGLAGGADAYPTASPAERRRIWETHRGYTHRLLWFLRNDAAVPEAVRNNLRQWSLPKDEFPTNGHWPWGLYVREGRRMIGDIVMTQADLFDTIEKKDSISLGSFPVDSHVVRRLATPDGKAVINEGGYLVIPRIYQVPYRAMTPKRAECENLLVPVALSSSRVAFNSLRVEPTWMALGEAAGAAAALAAKTKKTVQDIDVSVVQKRLRAGGLPIEDPEKSR